MKKKLNLKLKKKKTTPEERFRKLVPQKLGIKTLIAILLITFLTTLTITLAAPAEPKQKQSTFKQVQFEKTDSKISDTIRTDSDTIRLLFVGDTMLARSIGQGILNDQNPFQHVKEKFFEYDMVIANLETNISTPGISYAVPGKKYTFNAPVESIQLMKENNIKAVSLANNHTMDYFAAGLLDQIKLMNEQQMVHFGAGENAKAAFLPKFLLIEDTTIAFLGFNDVETWYTAVTETTAGNANFDETKARTAIQFAKDNSDLIIVMPHWGFDYVYEPTDRQVEWGKKFIDWGADIVVGNHPHVIQRVDEYQGKEIHYSLGNFVFDGMWGISGGTDGYMLEVLIANGKIESTKKIEIKINGVGYPEIK